MYRSMQALLPAFESLFTMPVPFGVLWWMKGEAIHCFEFYVIALTLLVRSQEDICSVKNLFC